ncbi:hypothetical protein GCM10027514_43290 [Azotobacter armeniacus]
MRFFSNLPACTVVMETCAGSHFIALVHPAHEVVEVLAPDRSPQVDPALWRRRAVLPVPGAVAVFQPLRGLLLRGVWGETVLFDGLPVGSQR